VRGITGLFYQRLEGIEQYVHLLGDLHQLGASNPALSATRTLLGRRATGIRHRLRLYRDWETISLDGCVLSIAAEFELTARDLAEWLVGGMCLKVQTYNDLPDKIKQENVRQVGELLRSVGRPRVAHINYINVVSDLAQSTTVGTPVAVFTEGFAMHDQNLRAEQVSEIYGRARVKDLWPRLGANRWLRAYFGGLAAAETPARGKLNEFMEHRNQIAHRGASYQTLGPTIVLDFILFFRCLVGALAEVLDRHLADFPDTAVSCAAGAEENRSD